jgi:hypothetical protein
LPEVQIHLFSKESMIAGEFLNVRLSPVELEKLRSRFGPQVTEDYIERLSCYLKRHPRRKCYSAYATILTWIRKDGTIEAHTPEPQPLIDEMELRHRAEVMQRYQAREGLPVVPIDEIVRRLKNPA